MRNLIVSGTPFASTLAAASVIVGVPPPFAMITPPVPLKVAGHSGPSGRYESWREEAFITTFVLSQLDLTS